MASSTSPAPGLGSGSSSRTSVSGPPTRLLNIAFIDWYLPTAGLQRRGEASPNRDFGRRRCAIRRGAIVWPRQLSSRWLERVRGCKGGSRTFMRIVGIALLSLVLGAGAVLAQAGAPP